MTMSSGDLYVLTRQDSLELQIYAVTDSYQVASAWYFGGEKTDVYHYRLNALINVPIENWREQRI